MEGWLTALAIITPLAGVWLGGLIQRNARLEERERLERFEFLKDASKILGRTGVTLRASDPLDFAALASLDDIWDRIELRRSEANDLRPQLSELAVRWPEGASNLSTIEKHLGYVPTRLTRLVQVVRAQNDEEFKEAFGQASESHSEAMNAFDGALRALHSDDQD